MFIRKILNILRTLRTLWTVHYSASATPRGEVTGMVGRRVSQTCRMCGEPGHNARTCAGRVEGGRRRSGRGHGENPLFNMPAETAMAFMEGYARHLRVRHVSECSVESPVCGCVGLVEIGRAPCPSKTIEELKPGYLRVRKLQAPRGRNSAEIGAIMDGQLGLFNGSETIGAGVPVCRFVAERIVRVKPRQGTRALNYCMKLREESGVQRYLIPPEGHGGDLGVAHIANHICDPDEANVAAEPAGESVILRAIRDIEPFEEIVYNYYAAKTRTRLETVEMCFCRCCLQELNGH